MLIVFFARDADDAVRGRDGYDYYGYRLRVELAKGNRRDRDRDRDRGDRDRDRNERGARKTFIPPNTGYRVVVEGLPPSASWQDLKDFIRQVVPPAYTNVEKDRDGVVGIVEFDSADDMDRCIRKLDDTKFKNPFDDNCMVRIVEDRKAAGRSRDRSRSRSPKRGRSPGPRGRDRDRDRSYSPPPARRDSRSPPPRDKEDERDRSRSPVREDNDRSPTPP